MNELDKRAQGYCDHHVPKEYHQYDLKTFKDGFREGEMESDSGDGLFMIGVGVGAGAVVIIVALILLLLDN